MPYQTEGYNPPPVPAKLIQPIRTYEDVRAAITSSALYLQQTRSQEVTFFQQLQANINQAATTQGANIAAAATISISSFMHVITGTGTISTMQVPKAFAGLVLLASLNGFSMTTGGNISRAITTTAGQLVIAAFFPVTRIWYVNAP